MKPNERFLIPGEGLRVVDPATNQALPPQGAIVRGNDEHWIRRLNDGDVTLRTDEEKSHGRAERSKPSATLVSASKE